MTLLRALRIPRMGSVENAKLVAWHVAEGAAYVAGQLLYEVETDKTLTEVEADEDGVLARRTAAVDDELKVGDTVGWSAPPGADAVAVAAALAGLVEPGEALAPAVAAPATLVARVAPARAPVAGLPLSPRVRRLARDHGIDLARVAGSGPGGRIVGADVLAAATARDAAPAAADPSALPPGYEAIPHTRIANSLRRRTIARRLAEAARAAPHLTADIQIDLGALLTRRAASAAPGTRAPGILAHIVHAVCRVLPRHPALNATWTDSHSLHWRALNIGIAVDTADGLVVPVLRDAGALPVEAIDAAIVGLAARARDGTLQATELEGGTFTISNPGSIGPVLRAEAILNPPQVALLGLPAMLHAPVAMAGADGNWAVEVRPLIRPSLTFDHRALDGAQVIRFLADLKAVLEAH